MTDRMITQFKLFLFLLWAMAAVSACGGNGTAPPATPAFPTVIATAPVSGAVRVSLNSVVTATFSEAMDSATITVATFTLATSGGGPVPGKVALSGTTATFTPDAPLADNATYVATITTGARNTAGTSLGANFTWSFSTGPGQGDLGTAPRVTLTVPAANSAGIAVITDISATFSKAMDATTVTTASFTLTSGAGPVSGTVSMSADKTTAIFDPTGQLAPNTTYTATIATAAKDSSGISLATNFVWSFTTGATGDTTPPAVTSTAPVSQATGVPLDAPVSATFSEAMDAATISAATFTLTSGTGLVPGTVTANGATATFKPTGQLAPGTTYTAVITTGAKDLAGNPLAVTATWSFTTGTALSPAITSTSPANNATGVATSVNVTATFSKAMDPATINQFTFTLSSGFPVQGTVTLSGTTATFDPIAPLQANTTYTATITTGAKDTAGNPLSDDFTWSFTTGAL